MNEIQYVTIVKSTITQKYMCAEPINYDFYLLYLLFTQTFTPTTVPSETDPTNTNNFQKNSGINFCKSSSTSCLATSQLFMHKNHGYIELFASYDLLNNEDLSLPRSPKFIMTAKNFMNFMMQKRQLQKQQPEKVFIIIDKQGHAHLTTTLELMTKISLLSMLQKKLASFFQKPAN